MNADNVLNALGMVDEAMIADAEQTPKFAKRRSARKTLILAAAVILCLSLTLPVLAAADVEPAYRLLYALSPAAAQGLKPVQMSCEDNGIRMEVAAAKIEGDTADILICMQDLTGDRVDGTIDLFDSYMLLSPFDSIGTCRFLDYDEAQRSAVFLVRISRMDGRAITGNKCTFCVREFLSGKTHFSGEIRGVDLSEVSASNDKVYTPIAGVEVRDICWQDGALRARVHCDDVRNTDNHGYLYLRCADGQIIEAEQDQNGPEWDDAGTGFLYEYVFDIPQEQLAEYQLCGEFWICDSLTKGNWQVTFPLKKE